MALNLNASHLKHLSPASIERLEEALRQFKKEWSDRLMTTTMSQLSPDHALRFATLVELTRTDLSQRWKRGQGPRLEHYLQAYPELGSSHTVPLYLIRAEYDIRLANGDAVDVGEYAQRFPTQFEAFYKGILKSKDATESKAEPLSPVAAALVGPQPVPVPQKSVTPKVRRVPDAPALVPVQATPAPSKSHKGLVIGALILGVSLGVIAAGLWKFRSVEALKNSVDTETPKNSVASEAPKNSVDTETPKNAVATEAPKKPAAKTSPSPIVNARNDSNKPNPPTPALGNFKATEPVESILVKIDVGAGSETDEAIYLDLGLGFPLWLAPGTKVPAPVAFGAVPQESDAKDKLAPGTTASFTFRTTGVPGRDVLGTTPPLLAGINVGDIRRVGFASLAKQDWEFDGFELVVNGKVLQSAKGLKLRPKQLQAEAQAKLGTLTLAAAPVIQELTDLKDLVQSGLATDAEKIRLAALEQQPQPTTGGNAEQVKLQRQLRGESPWFQTDVKLTTDPKVAAGRRSGSIFDLFESTAHAQDAVLTLPTTDIPKLVQLTVVTDPTHERSDTNNFVFLKVGSRKYLIGGPDFPLTSANGPQKFNLDLDAGPLLGTDLRDFGVGVLSPSSHQGKTPDFWHLSALRIDADGKTIYDSDGSENDRRTLEVVRLLPPTQLDLDGSVVVNPSNGREMFFWSPGTVSGFDLKTGNPDPLLPNPNDPNPPVAIVDPANPNPRGAIVDADNPLGGPFGPSNSSPANPNGIPPGGLLFPGESIIDLGIAPVGFGANPLQLKPLLNFLLPPVVIIAGPTPQFVLGPFPGSGTNPINFTVNSPNDPVVPPPKTIGNPIQINTVSFTQLGGLFDPRNFQIDWTVSGTDESNLVGYDVFLVGWVDDLSGLGSGTTAATQLGTNLPQGSRSLAGTVPDSFLNLWKFVRPVVVANMTDPTKSTSGNGPAGSTARFDPGFMPETVARLRLLRNPAVTPSNNGSFSLHTGLPVLIPENKGLIIPLVDPTKPAVTLSLRSDPVAAGTVPVSVRFHVGFQGPGMSNTVKYRVEAFGYEVPSAGGVVSTTVPIDDTKVSELIHAADLDGFFTLDGSEGNCHLVRVDLSPLAAPMAASPNSWFIELTVTMKDFKGDSTCPPVLFNTAMYSN